MKIEFHGLPSADVARAKASGTDVYGLAIERQRSDGAGIPCRHCLRNTPAGQDYLILAWRPFSGLNAYTETGPLFLCAADCPAAPTRAEPPPILSAPQYLLRGYTGDERIAYGTGKVVAQAQIADYARQVLSDPQIAFVDVRSAANNCYLCRIRRTP